MSFIDSSADPVVNILLGVLIFAFVIYRQSVKRAVKEDRSYLVNIILLVIGATQVLPYLGTVPTGLLVGTLVSLVLGGLFGWLRGSVTSLTVKSGIAYRQGNVKTILLWLTSVASHVALGALTGEILKAATAKEGTAFSSATVLIYLAVTLGVQKYIIQRRVRRLRIIAS